MKDNVNWIKISDKYPDVNEFLITDSKFICIARLGNCLGLDGKRYITCTNGCCCIHHDCCCWEDDLATHWMKLPELPNPILK